MPEGMIYRRSDENIVTLAFEWCPTAHHTTLRNYAMTSLKGSLAQAHNSKREICYTTPQNYASMVSQVPAAYLLTHSQNIKNFASRYCVFICTSAHKNILFSIGVNCSSM